MHSFHSLNRSALGHHIFSSNKSTKPGADGLVFVLSATASSSDGMAASIFKQEFVARVSTSTTHSSLPSEFRRRRPLSPTAAPEQSSSSRLRRSLSTTFRHPQERQRSEAMCHDLYVPKDPSRLRRQTMYHAKQGPLAGVDARVPLLAASQPSHSKATGTLSLPSEAMSPLLPPTSPYRSRQDV